MKKSIRSQILLSFEAYTTEKEQDWLLKWPGQCVNWILISIGHFLINHHTLGSCNINDLLDRTSNKCSKLQRNQNIPDDAIGKVE